MKVQLLATEPRRLMGEDTDLIDLLVSELRGGAITTWAEIEARDDIDGRLSRLR